MLRIDTWDVRCFLVAASSRSFNAASKQLWVSQPTVTRAISALEEQFQVSLFERTSTGAVLTPAGELIRDYFAGKAEELEDVTEKARLIQSNTVGNLAIGFLEGQMIHPEMSHALSLFLERYPQIKLDLYRDDYNQLYSKVLSGEYDCIELPTRTFSSPELRILPLYTYQTYVCIPEQCPAYKKKGNLTFDDLLHETLIYINKIDHPFNRFTTRWMNLCRERGIEPSLLCVSGAYEVQFAIELGRGFCLTNVNNNLMYGPRVYCEEFDEFPPAEFSFMLNVSNTNRCIKLFERILGEVGFPFKGGHADKKP